MMNPNFLLAHGNRYLEAMEYRQKITRGFLNFISHMKNLHVLVFRTDRQTDGRTDGQTDTRMD